MKRSFSNAVNPVVGVTVLGIVGLWLWGAWLVIPPPFPVSSLGEVERIISFKLPKGTQLVEAVHARGFRPYLFCKVNLTPEGHGELIARLTAYGDYNLKKGYFLRFARHAPRSLRSDPDLNAEEGIVQTFFDPRPDDLITPRTSHVILNVLVVPNTPTGPVAFFHWDQD